MPFDPHDHDSLLQHFENHGAEFGAATPEQYEAMADAFMNREPVTPPLFECVRDNGMRCRFDRETNEYGVVHAWGWLATYFKPVAAGHLHEDERPLGSHGYLTNMQYFRSRCR